MAEMKIESQGMDVEMNSVLRSGRRRHNRRIVMREPRTESTLTLYGGSLMACTGGTSNDTGFDRL